MKHPRFSKDGVLSLFKNRNILIQNSHFVYTNPKGHGDHGDAYVNKENIYTHPHDVSNLCREMACRLEPVVLAQKPVVAVVGPEKGGIMLSSWLAYHLKEEYRLSNPEGSRIRGQVFSLFAEKKDGSGFVLKRGYDKLVQKHLGWTIVVEDVVNSVGSVRETIKAVENAGGAVVAVMAICDRSRGGFSAQKLGVSYAEALLPLDLKKYPEEDCPLCKAKVPIREDLGHGADFLKRKAAEVHPDADIRGSD
jgi:orotate phosphoribosyltransferase